MREQERIDRICKKLYLVWSDYPDMRLGQFLENYIFGHHTSHPDGCIFHIEDNIVEKKLDEMREKVTSNYNSSKGQITGGYKTQRARLPKLPFDEEEHGCIIACNYCQRRFDELDNRIDITNIEENILGQDVVTFKCPECGKETTSLRYG